MRRVALGVVLILCFLAAGVRAVRADGFKPIIIYQGDILQNSFNATIHDGVLHFLDKTGIRCEERVVGNGAAEYMGELEKVSQAGYDPVFLIYGNHIARLTDFIRKYPNTRFVALGTIKDAPNLFSLDFAEHEGSFLAGALAAMATRTKTIAFVSVSDLPLMRRFSCGYEQGAKYIDPTVKVLVGFTGSYKNAWFDGAATAKMADGFMDQGADVIYQAAGAAGPAVLEAAAERGKLGIGVDRNQNGLYPGHVLTSMLKRTDQVVYAALVHAQRGVWRDNIKQFGLVQEAVGLAFDTNNAGLVTAAMRERIEQIKSRIMLGEIQVHDYVVDNSCP